MPKEKDMFSQHCKVDNEFRIVYIRSENIVDETHSKLHLISSAYTRKSKKLQICQMTRYKWAGLFQINQPVKSRALAVSGHNRT